LKYLAIILALFVLFIDCDAQDTCGTGCYAVEKFIMKDAKIFVPSYNMKSGDYFTSITIQSSCDSLFSNVNCVVAAVFDLGGEQALIIKDSLNRFYTFTPLKKLVYTKGENIQKGAFVGLVERDADENGFKLTLIISVEARSLNESEMWRIIHQQQ